MKYSDKVKQSKEVLEAIYGLKDKETIRVAYGVDRDGVPNYYRVKAYKGYRDEMSYSIHKDSPWAIDGMNIESLTKTQAKAYTYDMMSQRTNYNFPLYSMHVLPEIVTK